MSRCRGQTEYHVNVAPTVSSLKIAFVKSPQSPDESGGERDYSYTGHWLEYYHLPSVWRNPCYISQYDDECIRQRAIRNKPPFVE